MKEIKFAENLKRLRITNNLTQFQLAEKIGINQRTVSAWEKGICEPNYSILSKLCEIFDEDFNNILT